MKSTAAREDPTQVEFYEGLVRKTAARYDRQIQEEFEDVCQMLRLKAWRALESFDPARATQPIEKYVFSCIVNQVKDLLKRKQRTDLHIEDLAGRDNGEHGLTQDGFESRYWMESEEDAFHEILRDTPLIPSTLDAIEVRVMVCLYLEYTHAQIALRLGLTKREVRTTVKVIRVKMADWAPAAVQGQPALAA